MEVPKQFARMGPVAGAPLSVTMLQLAAFEGLPICKTP